MYVCVCIFNWVSSHDKFKEMFFSPFCLRGMGEGERIRVMNSVGGERGSFHNYKIVLRSC